MNKYVTVFASREKCEIEFVQAESHEGALRMHSCIQNLEPAPEDFLHDRFYLARYGVLVDATPLLVLSNRMTYYYFYATKFCDKHLIHTYQAHWDEVAHRYDILGAQVGLQSYMSLDEFKRNAMRFGVFFDYKQVPKNFR